MSVQLWLVVGLLGGLGALLRFGVDRAISLRADSDYPVGTLAINLSGAFLLGVLNVAHLSTTITLLLGAATLGSYTTFSTWMLESHRLAEDGRTTLTALNLSAGLLLGVSACALGRALGGLL